MSHGARGHPRDGARRYGCSRRPSSFRGVRLLAGGSCSRWY